MNTLAEIGSRTLKCVATLEENFQRRVRQWLDEMIQTGIRPLIYCGLRTFEEQLALYAQGRTKPGKIVTKAKPGESYHNYGLAFDWVPMRPSAKNGSLLTADWEDETAFKVGEQAGHTFNLTAISWETGHLQDGRYQSWRDIPGNENSRVATSAPHPTKPTRKATLRKP